MKKNLPQNFEKFKIFLFNIKYLYLLVFFKNELSKEKWRTYRGKDEKKLVIRLRGANATSLHQKVDNKYKEIGIQAKLSPGSREQTPIQQSYAILSEMQENISKTPKGRRWSHYFRKFTIGLFFNITSSTYLFITIFTFDV